MYIDNLTNDNGNSKSKTRFLSSSLYLSLGVQLTQQGKLNERAGQATFANC